MALVAVYGLMDLVLVTWAGQPWWTVYGSRFEVAMLPAASTEWDWHFTPGATMLLAPIQTPSSNVMAPVMRSNEGMV